MIRQLSAAALLLALGACASGPKMVVAPPHAPTTVEATRILAFAREIRQNKGCEAALPAYRVVAAMGEGFEPAQDELGECLLEATGEGATEIALRREEALLWLKRAAYAGNARAQRALAVLYAEPASGQHSNEDAYKWALVYKANTDAALYGYKDFPPTFVPGLEAALSPDAAAAAKDFAQDFKPVHLAIYQGPPHQVGGRHQSFQRGGYGEGQGGRRRRGPGGGQGPGDDDGDDGPSPY